MTAMGEAAQNPAGGPGDQLAIEALLERHLPGLRAFVRLRAGPAVRTRESTTDVVQSACREVLAHFDWQRADRPAGRRMPGG
jgi:DNA-directed RNA polymerase specialized sigma24 family protein